MADQPAPEIMDSRSSTETAQKAKEAIAFLARDFEQAFSEKHYKILPANKLRTN